MINFAEKLPEIVNVYEMNNISDHGQITPESVMASVEAMLAKFAAELERSAAEFDRRSAEFNLQLKQSREENDRKWEKSREENDMKWEQSREENDRKWEKSREENDRKWEKSREENEKERKQSREENDMKWEKSREENEKKWAQIRENNEREWKQSRKNNDRDWKEHREAFDRDMKEHREEFDMYIKKHREEFDRDMKELKISMADTDRKIKSLTEQVAGITRSNGDIAEDYFFNSFQRGQKNFFGESFDKIIRGKGQIVEDEYDVIMINGHTAGIIEVKYKARKDDIPKALKKVNTFRINFPEHKDHKIYLALAAYSFNENLQRECLKQGIAVIKQVGDTVIVYDKHLKAF